MTDVGDIDQFQVRALNDVPKLSQYRPNRQFSFRASSDKGGRKDLDPCLDLSLEQVQDFISKKGRNWFEIVTYAADQVKNFPSQYSRYQRGASMRPDRVIERNGKPVYLFCQSGSTDFWEVTQAGITYLKLTRSLFTIICPVPWTLSSLGQLLDTDGSDGDVVWRQLQGRETSITPDNAIDPVFYTYGLRDALDPPILIVVEAVDDADLFDFLAIDPIARSLHYNSAYAPGGEFDIDPTKRIEQFYLVPSPEESAYLWTGQSLRAAYLPPVETENFIDGLINDVPNAPHISFEVTQNTWYVPKSLYAWIGANDRATVTGLAYSVAYPPLWDFPVGRSSWLFADNAQSVGAAISSTDFQFTFYPPSILTSQYVENCNNASARANMEFEFFEFGVGVKNFTFLESYIAPSAIANMVFEFTVYASEGVIIG
jgi:hypothetical protein